MSKKQAPLDLAAALNGDKPVEKRQPAKRTTTTKTTATRTPRKATKKPAPAPRATPTTKTAMNRAGMVALGLYMPASTYQAARSAYLADFQNRGDEAPNGFDHWVADAVVRHAHLSPAQRTRRVGELPAQEADEDRKQQVKVRISEDVDNTLNRAVEKGEKAGLFLGRSPFTVEAIRCAVEDARELNGGALPEAPPGRLPIRRRVR